MEEAAPEGANVAGSDVEGRAVYLQQLKAERQRLEASPELTVAHRLLANGECFRQASTRTKILIKLKICHWNWG